MTINGTGKIRWDRFFISALVWLLLSAGYFFIYLKMDPSNFVINNSSKTLIGLIIVSLLFVPFQSALEEVIFRGYLMQGFTVLFKNRWLPLIFTSVLFGLLHAFNPEVRDFGFFTMMPHYIIFGLIFGVITILDDGIESAMGAHAANNIFLCIMVTQESSALKTAALYEQHNVYPWSEFAALVITGILFIFIMKLIFKWKDFSPLAGRVDEKC
jgi:membrane protease YdiL (CAAX protease family)